MKIFMLMFLLFFIGCSNEIDKKVVCQKKADKIMEKRKIMDRTTIDLLTKLKKECPNFTVEFPSGDSQPNPSNDKNFLDDLL